MECHGTFHDPGQGHDPRRDDHGRMPGTRTVRTHSAGLDLDSLSGYRSSLTACADVEERCQISRVARSADFSRASDVADHIPERADSQGEMGRGDRSLARSARILRRCRMVRAAPDRVDLAQEEGDEPEPGQPPARLGQEQQGMGQDGGRQPAGGHVGPEDELGVPGHPPLEGRAGVVVGGRDLVEHPAPGSEDAAIAGPAEPKAQIHVLVIGAQKRIETANLADGLGAVEGTRAAGGEHVLDGRLIQRSADWPWPRLVGQPARV